MRFIYAAILIFLITIRFVYANQLDSIEELGANDITLSSDSLDSSDQIKDLDVVVPSEQSNNSLIDKNQEEVSIFLLENISTSYSNESQFNSILILRNALNLTRINYSGGIDAPLLTTEQTEKRIQQYFGQTVANKLEDCGIKVDLNFEYSENNKTENKLKNKINLGVSKLILSKTLLTVTLSGEAKATLFSYGETKKSILIKSEVGSYKLRKFNEAELERDIEIKSVASDLVDGLAKTMGSSLCKYFN